MVNVLQELACLPYQKNTTRANLEECHEEKQQPEERDIDSQEPEERDIESQEPEERDIENQEPEERDIESQEPDEMDIESQGPEERDMEDDQQLVDSVEVHICNFCFLISLLIAVISNK